jgi:hypothetical protein
MKRSLDYYLLCIAVILSLSLNVYILSVLREARRQVGVAAGNASVSVGQLADGAIDYTVQIDEVLPVSMTVGYADEITVPISVTLPISTEVEVPLRTPLGTFPIVVPVITSFPVRLNPVIPISIELPISTTIPVRWRSTSTSSCVIHLLARRWTARSSTSKTWRATSARRELLHRRSLR